MVIAATGGAYCRQGRPHRTCLHRNQYDILTGSVSGEFSAFAGAIQAIRTGPLSHNNKKPPMNTLGTGIYRISSDYLILLTELAFEQGLSAGDLLPGSGLTEDILFQPGVSVGHESCLHVVDRFCQLTGDMSLALDYGKRMTLARHGALGYAAQYSATMADAAQKVMRYVETRAQIFAIRRAASHGQRHLIIEARFGHELAGPFLTLAFLSSIETICRTLTGPRGQQACSCIHSTVSADLSQQTTLPHCQVLTGQSGNRLSWPESALEHPLPFFNPQLENLAQSRLESALNDLNRQQSLSERVTQILDDHLAQMPAAGQVASMLCMSAATLNRHLRNEGSSFRQLRDEVRFRHARQLLQSPLAVEQIAARLGYSDASNFATAFRSWSGVSPSAYRRQPDACPFTG